VLDEPTNSLDLRAYRDFVACLRVLAGHGTNIILVTHHLPDIVPEIDRVVVLKDGRVFRDGPKADVLSSDVLSDAFGVPVDVEARDGFYGAW
jgi:iron complex transport system ATP-binding protein